jgi:segregation and condensation protein A
VIEEFADGTEVDPDEARLVLDLVGFEGPLDLLLDLARRQKIDLHEISISALAEQYLGFIEEMRRVRLELAADYLVMAAWLAYLKSRLLLPEPPKADGPSAAEMAGALAARLRRLEAIREAARRLDALPRLGRDVFARGVGEPEGAVVARPAAASLYELLSAYATRRDRRSAQHVTVARRRVWALADARACLERLVGQAADWTSLDAHLLRFIAEPAMRATILASSLSAALEMVRENGLSLRQDQPFGPIFVRAPQEVAA